MTVLAALRAGTTDAHDRLEAAMGLGGAAFSRRRYEDALRLLLAVRQGWEPELEALHPGSAGPHLAWLRADHAALGLEPLPPAAALGVTEAEGWGVRYVLEGSALGGTVIAREAVRLGISAAHGGRYFAGRGAETGAHWRGFLFALERAQAEAAVRGACLAFETLLQRTAALSYA